ncbi:hypothetical protein RUM43_006874 [Polyplax serrata]|uniref:Uncharacterized protein n=1 Tax=Polyplax serrata TaxID=468196 RepID=A0AAN8PL76_POLSC
MDLVERGNGHVSLSETDLLSALSSVLRFNLLVSASGDNSGSDDGVSEKVSVVDSLGDNRVTEEVSVSAGGSRGDSVVDEDWDGESGVAGSAGRSGDSLGEDVVTEEVSVSAGGSGVHDDWERKSRVAGVGGKSRNLSDQLVSASGGDNWRVSRDLGWVGGQRSGAGGGNNLVALGETVVGRWGTSEEDWAWANETDGAGVSWEDVAEGGGSAGFGSDEGVSEEVSVQTVDSLGSDEGVSEEVSVAVSVVDSLGKDIVAEEVSVAGVNSLGDKDGVGAARGSREL